MPKLIYEPGDKVKDPNKGWFIVNEDRNRIYLEDDKKEYIKVYKQYHDVPVLSEAMNEKAQKFIAKDLTIEDDE